jgi:peroxiredoxin
VDIALLMARLLLAGVFALAGAAKLVDRAGSRQAMIDFGVSMPLAAPLGILLPLAELAVAAALMPAGTAWAGAVGAVALLLLFVVGISVNLAQGRKPDCRCFGQLHSAPAGPRTLARNGALAGVAGFVVWQGSDGVGPSALGWMGEPTAAQLVALILGLVALALLGGQWWFLLHLFRQNGRLLVRVAALEAGGIGATPSGNGTRQAAGLPVGSVAPAFSLQDLHGEEVALDDLRGGGKPVVLIFTSPECNPCTELLPEIAHWQQKHSEKLAISLVSHLGIEENRAKVDGHRVQQVLMQEDWEVAEAYQVEATPSAVLITPDGAVGSPLAEGSDAVETLVAQAIGARSQLPLLHSTAHTAQEPIPAGLEVGEPAPEVRLPDLEGRNVSLEDFRGDKTLLLFWSPGCGFCQEMLPKLKELEADPPAGAPAILVVSDGPEEDNRQMDLLSPVVLDHNYAVGDAFGVEGTPSAVLVDGGGHVASEVAVGAKAVLKLARAG